MKPSSIHTGLQGVLCRLRAGSHSCCEVNILEAVSWHFAALLPIIWFKLSFCLIFHDVSWDLEEDACMSLIVEAAFSEIIS